MATDVIIITVAVSMGVSMNIPDSIAHMSVSHHDFRDYFLLGHAADTDRRIHWSGHHVTKMCYWKPQPMTLKLNLRSDTTFSHFICHDFVNFPLAWLQKD